MQALIDGFKLCNVCNENKSLSEFHLNKTCKNGVTGTCRKCNRERINKWYYDNRVRRQELANDLNRKRKKEIVDHFGNRCLDCGKSTLNMYTNSII